jgi:hypothetical protein
MTDAQARAFEKFAAGKLAGDKDSYIDWGGRQPYENNYSGNSNLVLWG